MPNTSKNQINRREEYMLGFNKYIIIIITEAAENLCRHTESGAGGGGGGGTVRGGL